MTELPLLIIDVQRGGPSTGLPTKTEQADLLQAMYGRNGESPIPILAAKSPSDCFSCTFEAAHIAFTYNTPVILLSDGYIANGSEPWKIPSIENLPHDTVSYANPNEEYIPYKRDPITLSRKLALPGTPGLEHQIGGLEKTETGSVSYDPRNHEKMVHLRSAKVSSIANEIPPTQVCGAQEGDVLVVGWGGTYGAITSAVYRHQKKGHLVSSIHLRYIYPFPLDLQHIFSKFKKILVPELNMGQYALLLRSKYLINAISFTKIQGQPFHIQEIEDKISEFLNE